MLRHNYLLVTDGSTCNVGAAVVATVAAPAPTFATNRTRRKPQVLASNTSRSCHHTIVLQLTWSGLRQVSAFVIVTSSCHLTLSPQREQNREEEYSQGGGDHCYCIAQYRRLRRWAQTRNQSSSTSHLSSVGVPKKSEGTAWTMSSRKTA